MKANKKLSGVLVAGGFILVSVISSSAAEQKKEEVNNAFFYETGESICATKEIEGSLKKQVAADIKKPAVYGDTQENKFDTTG